jgi:predicted RNase H-like HicB family nuclease
MKTWTCTTFTGHWPVGTALVVTADNIELAIELVEKELAQHNLPQEIKPEQLIPLPTHHRHVKILRDGEY